MRLQNVCALIAKNFVAVLLDAKNELLSVHAKAPPVCHPNVVVIVVSVNVIPMFVSAVPVRTSEFNVALVSD